MKSILVVVCITLGLFIQNGEAVRCFTCSSDLTGYCDPFDPDKVHLEDCDRVGGIHSNSRTACKVVKTIVNGNPVVTRGCTWKSAEDKSSSCPNSISSRNVVTSFCETCDFDACNLGPAAEKTGVGKTLKRLFGAKKD